MIIGFQFGDIFEMDKSELAANTWCVRGGYGYDTESIGASQSVIGF
jgi:hypothetical protein